MSRLDSAIRRLEAQRACLDMAADAVRGRDGPVCELGLGNGRTFDHLRSLLPAHPIYCFDRQVAAHPDCVPDPEHLFLGEFAETLPRAADRLGGSVILAHCDTGSGDRQASRRQADWLGPALKPLLADGALVISDQALDDRAYEALALPDGVAAGRYHVYRYRASPA